MINLVFGLALWKALASFRHDMAISSGLAQMRTGTKSLFGIVFQAGWSSVYSPLEGFVSTLSLGCDLDYSFRPALPPCAPTVSGETLDTFYHDLL